MFPVKLPPKPEPVSITNPISLNIGPIYGLWELSTHFDYFYKIRSIKFIKRLLFGGTTENGYSESIILCDLTKYIINEMNKAINIPLTERLSSLTWWIDRELVENNNNILNSSNWSEFFRRMIIRNRQLQYQKEHPEIDFTTTSNDLWKYDPLLENDPYLPDDDPLFQCYISLIQLMTHPDSISFLEPVEGIKNYYDVIKNPIDMSTIGNKLLSAWYTPLICTTNYESLNPTNNNVKLDELYNDEEYKKNYNNRNNNRMEEESDESDNDEMEGEEIEQDGNPEQTPHQIDDDIENKLEESLRKIPKKSKDFGERYGMRYIKTKGGNKNGGISSFASDVRLIWQNCRQFNTKDTSVYRMSQKLQTLFEKLSQIVNISVDLHREKYGDKPIHGYKIYKLVSSLNQPYIYKEPNHYSELKKKYLDVEYGGSLDNNNCNEIASIDETIEAISYFDFSIISLKYKISCFENMLQYILNDSSLISALNSQQEHYEEYLKTKDKVINPIQEIVNNVKDERHKKEQQVKSFLKTHKDLNGINYHIYFYIALTEEEKKIHETLQKELLELKEKESLENKNLKQSIQEFDKKANSIAEKMVPNITPIGSDKNHNKYWIFPSDPYHILWRQSKYYDVNDKEEWKYYNSSEQINQLIESLDIRGRREYILHNQLLHFKQSIMNAYKHFEMNNSFPFLPDEKVESDIRINISKTAEGLYPESERFGLIELIKKYENILGKNAVLHKSWEESDIRKNIMKELELIISCSRIDALTKCGNIILEFESFFFNNLIKGIVYPSWNVERYLWREQIRNCYTFTKLSYYFSLLSNKMCNPDVIEYITVEISKEEYYESIKDYMNMRPSPLLPNKNDKLIYFGEGHRIAYLTDPNIQQLSTLHELAGSRPYNITCPVIVKDIKYYKGEGRPYMKVILESYEDPSLSDLTKQFYDNNIITIGVYIFLYLLNRKEQFNMKVILVIKM